MSELAEQVIALVEHADVELTEWQEWVIREAFSSSEKAGKSWYRSLLPDGSVWCESSDPRDLARPGPDGKTLTLQRCTVYATTLVGAWEPYEPEGS